MKETKKIIRRGIHLGVIMGVILVMFLFASQVHNILPEQYARNWRTVVSAEGVPQNASGGSCVLQVFIYPHSASPGEGYGTVGDYASNVTVGANNSYAYHDYLNNTLTGEVPYDTTFDIVVKVRANVTHAYNSSGSNWELPWIRSNATCSDLSFSTENLSMTEVEIANSSTFIWVHYYLQDADGGAGSGFTISHGESVNVTYFKFEAYF